MASRSCAVTDQRRGGPDDPAGVARALGGLEKHVQISRLGQSPADPIQGVAIFAQDPETSIRREPVEKCGHVISDRPDTGPRSEEHTSELQSQSNLVCRLLLEKKK